MEYLDRILDGLSHTYSEALFFLTFEENFKI